MKFDCAYLFMRKILWKGNVFVIILLYTFVKQNISAYVVCYIARYRYHLKQLFRFRDTK